MINTWSKSVIVSSFGETPAQRGLPSGAALNLFVRVNEKPVATEASALSIDSVSGEEMLRRAPYNHDLACTHESDQAVIGSPAVSAKA